jgi:hypothetical protein
LETQSSVNLSSINGIGKSSLELLEAAGFHDVESIAKAGVDELTLELQRANSILKISKRSPGRAAVGKWIAMARDIVGAQESADGAEQAVEMPVNYERSPEVAAMLAAAPFALPLPAKVLMENNLGVSEIPPGILLNRYSGDLDVRIEQRLPKTRQAKAAAASGYVSIADTHAQRLEIDVSKLRSTEDLGEPLVKGPSIKVSPANDRIALLRAPRSSTNEGRDPNSRWYIRGVLHSHPVSIYLGAAATLLVMLLIPASAAAIVLLMLSGEMPDRFGWVPRWLLAVPVALPLCGIFYLMWGIGGSCRICGQKLFVHRSHLKNSKAHHVPGLGYVIPLCFQILIFRWFRCTHCGTPVRLKE